MSIFDLVLQSLKQKRVEVTPESELNEESMIPSLVFASSDDFLEQRSSSYNSEPINGKERFQRGYTMKIKKGTKRVTLFKFLLSKLLFDENGLHLDEYIVLHELYFDFLDNGDPNFVSKYGRTLERSREFFQTLSEVSDFPVHWVRSCNVEDAMIKHFGVFALSKHAYFGMRGNRDIRNSFRISFNDAVLPQRLPPKRFIGVGYKDKGSRREPALDGSPGWEEIGTEFCQLERALHDAMLLTEERLSDDRYSSFDEEDQDS